jgi:hypothetical protein
MEQKSLTITQPAPPAVPFSDIERMAVAFAKSGLFGIKTAEQGVALMLIAQAEGLHPAVAARDYHVIQGRPALKADAMLARFQAAGGKVNWDVYTDTEVKACFSHPAGGSATVSWTISQAKNAGLCGKDVWRQYPRAMLRARVISEGIRTVYPGVSVGVYTPEELADFDAKPATREVESVPVHEPIVEPRQKLPTESLPKSAVDLPKSEGIIKTEKLPDNPKAQFDRKEAFKTLASSVWEKHELATYSEKAFKKKASKDLTDQELQLFMSVVQSSPFEKAIVEVDPTFEVDLVD